MRVIGIDTGSTKCGYGVVDMGDDGGFSYVECGTIKAANDNKWVRMHVIGDELHDVLRDFMADGEGLCAIESAFIPRDRFHGAETLAEARGCVAYVASSFGLRIVTVNPSTAKKAITGSGRADKEQVASMVRQLLKLRNVPAPDAADALAVAVAAARLERP